MAKDHPTGESGLYSGLLELKTPGGVLPLFAGCVQLRRAQRNGAALQHRRNCWSTSRATPSIMGNIGASSAIISRVSRVISRDDSVLRRCWKKRPEHPTEE